MSKFLPSEVARLVLSYLLENKLERTREVFLSECPALAELAQLTAPQQLHGSKVNGRNLSKILRDYNSVTDKITELAEGISSDENDDLQYLPPLKVLNVLAEHLTSNSPGKPAPVLINKSSQTIQVPKIFQSTESQTNKENEVFEGQDSQNEVVQNRRSRSPKRVSYFHPNIRVPPRPKPGPVPILPKPVFESAKAGSDCSARQSDTPLSDNNFQERLTRDEIVHSTPSQLRERERKGQPKKSKQSDDEFFDELLGNLGNKILSLIPENVSSENIADIAEEGANNEGIIADFLNMFGDSTASDETGETSGETDSRVNTPVTSPVSDLMETDEPRVSSEPMELVEILPVEDEAPEDQTKGFDASLSVTHVDSNVMDILGRAVNETINGLTSPVAKQKEMVSPKSNEAENKLKGSDQKKEHDPSKKPKNDDKNQKIMDFKRMLGNAVSNAEAPTESSDKVEEENVIKLNKEDTDRIVTLSPNTCSFMMKQISRAESDGVRQRHVSSDDINIITDPGDAEKNIVVEVLDDGAKIEVLVDGAKFDDKPKRLKRCNKCSGCLAEPCGECRECKDKKVNGGPGILKKACRKKQCENMKPKKMKPFSKVEQNIDIRLEDTSPGKSRGLSKPQQPYHVRTLQFSSSPKEDKQAMKENVSQGTRIKTLSPVRSSSPLKRTDAAWNDGGNEIFSSTQASHTASDQNNPYLIKKDLVGLNQPEIIKVSYSALAPVNLPLADLIPPTALPTLPAGFKSLGFSAIISPQEGPVPSVTIPAVNSHTEKSDKPDAENNKIDLEPSQETGKQSEEKPLEGGMATKKALKGSKKSQLTKNKAKVWDETLRASLGSAEKDTSHLTHRLTEREKKGKKRSPKKIVYEETPESDEENPVELALTDANIAPEAQKILDTFANQLLGKMEEAVEKNLLKPAASSKASAGAHGGGQEGKDCIACKMEGVIKGTRKSHEKPLSLSGLDELLDTVEHVVNDEAQKDPSSETQEPKAEEADKSAVFPKQVFKTPSKADYLIFKTPVKTAGGSLTTPLKSVEGISPLRSTKKSEGTPSSVSQRSLVMSPPDCASPRRSHLSVPLTPSRNSSSDGRVRHKSSLHTPVCTPTRQSELDSPTTPRSKNSPSLSYYTPSPSPRSEYSVPSPSYTPGLRFLQEEGDRLSQSDDSCSSPSPLKVGPPVGAQKRKTFRNLFKKATTESAGKELGSLLEQKISSYPFGVGEEGKTDGDGPEPFMSPGVTGGCDYTSSPQISLKPSPTPELSRHGSFVSPNRTCYLSPTGVALTSSILGFHQSPHNTTGSENVEDMVLQLDSDEENGIKISQTEAAHTVSVEAAGDSAVADTEDINVNLKAQTSVLNLSDESNTLSNQIGVKRDLEKNTAAVLASVQKISNIQLSEDESDEEVGLPSPKKVQEPVRDTTPKETGKTEDGKFVTFTPRKPRRVALITTKRKSPIKNGATRFECRHDANNLDKNLSSNASLILDQNLGEEASIDLGLEGTAPEVETEVEVVRKSPRKHKRKGTNSPSSKSTPAKKQKLPEKAELTMRKELTLSFSPVKRSEDVSDVPKRSEEEERSTTPTICKALGLQRIDTSKEDEEGNQGTEAVEEMEEKIKGKKTKSKDLQERDSIKRSSKSSSKNEKSIKHTSELSPRESSSKSSRSKLKKEISKDQKKTRSDSSSSAQSRKVKETSVPSVRKTESKVVNILRKTPSKTFKKEKPPVKKVEDAVTKEKAELTAGTSGLTFEQMAAESRKILTTLRLSQEATRVEDIQTKKGSEDFGLSRSKFFVFQEKLPFGYFEEDI